jgi:hypothetical protein
MERTQYMQKLMTQTYPQIAIEAITGSFEGAWERLIAKKLKKDVDSGHSQACEICESVGNDYMKAAYLITSSVIPENAPTY